MSRTIISVVLLSKTRGGGCAYQVVREGRGRDHPCHDSWRRTSFDIFVSKTISGKLHLSFTPWRRARSNTIRHWILPFSEVLPVFYPRFRSLSLFSLFFSLFSVFGTFRLDRVLFESRLRSRVKEYGKIESTRKSI